jgi:hypothetical protein
MSKHETPLTRRFWDEVGGTLIEEFPAVQKSKNNSQRLMDGVIILGDEKKIVSWRDVSLVGKDIVVVQTKANRLGMYLMGQAFFSRELMKRFEPKSIRAVIICTKDDSVMRELAESHGLEIVIYP